MHCFSSMLYLNKAFPVFLTCWALITCQEDDENRNFGYYGTLSADPRSLNDIYQAALKEDGELIVYAGGSASAQGYGVKAAFENQFPNITIQVIVDSSKFHDARIDYQLETNTLVADVAQLQTLQDFPRWKRQGDLLKYKPIGWDYVYRAFKDPDGYHTGIYVFAFSNNINKRLLPNQADWPTEACDYLAPEFKDKIVSTYPNDDDAILFWYKQVINKYGWTWLRRLMQNNPRFVRGAQYPLNSVLNGSVPAVFATFGNLKHVGDVEFVPPISDPFVSWPQQAAIFRKTKRPNTAKLYMSWWLDDKTQTNVWNMWSVRKDVPPPKGYESIFNYPGQTDPTAFGRFMANRVEVEKFQGEVTLFVGEVKGKYPTGDLGIYPTKMLPP